MNIILTDLISQLSAVKCLQMLNVQNVKCHEKSNGTIIICPVGLMSVGQMSITGVGYQHIFRRDCFYLLDNVTRRSGKKRILPDTIAKLFVFGLI